jgi:flagellar biosynthesis protein FlhB
MDERTQEPTPRRLAEARAQGRVAQSPILTFAGAAGAVALVLGGMGEVLAERMARGLAMATTVGYAPGLAMEALGGLAAIVVPVIAAAAGGAALVGMVQTGFLFAPRALGWRRGGVGMAEWVARMGIAAVAVGLAALAVGRAMGELSDAVGLDAVGLLAAGGALVLALGPAAVVAAGIGLADWGRRRSALHAALRMTRREVEDERREEEGDPGRRRMMRRRGRETLMAPLAGATLVVVDGERAVVMAGERVSERADGFAARRLVEGARGVRVRLVHDPGLRPAWRGGMGVDRGVLARIS